MFVCDTQWYRLGFSFDLFGTVFNWTTTAHTATTAAAAKMPPVIGSLVVLITRAHPFPPTIAGRLYDSSVLKSMRLKEAQ